MATRELLRLLAGFESPLCAGAVLAGKGALGFVIGFPVDCHPDGAY